MPAKMLYNVRSRLGWRRGRGWLRQGVRRAAVLLGDPVAVDVERQGERTVPQPFRHLHEVHPG